MPSDDHETSDHGGTDAGGVGTLQSATDRLHPVEQTAALRRGRRLTAAIAATVGSRGLGVIVPLVLIPVMLRYLGADLYGLWTAATALTGMAAFADLGLGNSLMTKLTACHARGQVERAKQYVSSAYLFLALIAAAACLLLWSVSDVVPWDEIFNATGAASPADARAMALICITAFVLNIPLSLVMRVQYAYQQVPQSAAWQTCSALSALPLVLAAVHADLGPTVVVAATVVGPLLVNAVNTLWVFIRQMPEIAPGFRAVDRRLASRLFRLSGLFLLLTVVMSVASNADTILVAHALGLSSVTAYAVPARLFAQLGLLISLVNTPLWSANGDALARGDIAWVRTVTWRMTVASTVTAVGVTVALVVAGDTLLTAWLGVPLGGDRWLLGGLGLWWLILAVMSPRFMVQNAAGVVSPQLLGWALYLAISIPAKWYGAQHFGIAAVPYIGAAVYLVTVVPAALVGYSKALSRHTPVVTPEGAEV